MLTVDINNPKIEKFFKNECNGEKDKFLENILQYIEIYNIKKSFKKGLEEASLINSGELEKRELKNILDEI
jgi:hypothetical protein